MTITFINFINGSDVGVIKRSRRLGLEVESLQVRGIVNAVFGQHLDRHATLHQHVLRQVDAAHAARAEVPQQLIFAEEEAFVLLVQQLVALPLGEQVLLDEETGAYTIEDLQSSNGTKVNGKRIRSADLVDADEIEIGNTRFRFLLKGAPGAS